ncbi:MAG: hypothetical protein V3S29_11875, partial [bacterium]
MWSIHDSFDLELQNIPTVPIVCTGFESIATSERGHLGMPALNWALVPYPLAGLGDAEREAKARAAYPTIVGQLTNGNGAGAGAAAPRAEPVPQAEPGPPAQPVPRAEPVRELQENIHLSGDSVNEVLERLGTTLEKLRWSDGLPLVPPTREAVDEMLAGTSMAPDEVVARLYPNEGKATVEKIAINAVMAGCRPDYLPILIAAVKCIATPRFRQELTLISTGSFFPTVIVNGPIAKKLDIN